MRILGQVGTGRRPVRVESIVKTDASARRPDLKESIHRVFGKYSHKIWDFLVRVIGGGRANKR